VSKKWSVTDKLAILFQRYGSLVQHLGIEHSYATPDMSQVAHLKLQTIIPMLLETQNQTHLRLDIVGRISTLQGTELAALLPASFPRLLEHL